MELPPALRQAVERALDGVALADLKRAADALSRGYREEARAKGFHLSNEMAVKAYLATRMPATFAAVRASLGAVAELSVDFAPRSVLDVGAGMGSAVWAAADCWPSLEEALLIEASPVARAWGEALSAAAPVAQMTWQRGDLTGGLQGLGPRDLVMLAYVLSELTPQAQADAVDRLWALTAGTLVIVEPGTPAGWARILVARARLIGLGAHIIAPCPHAQACPVAPPDWCHFSRRVARSRLHRQAKGADVPWEDEKYTYIAAARRPGQSIEGRVIARPRSGRGRVSLRLCAHHGGVEERLVTRRDGPAFRQARRLDWGDAMVAGGTQGESQISVAQRP